MYAQNKFPHTLFQEFCDHREIFVTRPVIKTAGKGAVTQGCRQERGEQEEMETACQFRGPGEEGGRSVTQ